LGILNGENLGSEKKYQAVKLSTKDLRQAVLYALTTVTRKVKNEVDGAFKEKQRESTD
jgi:hypothetical protein